MKKNLTVLFTLDGLEKVHLYKDVGLTPYYLGKEYNLDVDIVYSNSEKKELPKSFRNVSLIEIKYYKIWSVLKRIDKFRLLESFSFYKYLIKNAKKIDYLMFFHIRLDKFFLVLLYKFLNKNGKVYFKMDSDINGVLKSNIKNITFIRKVQKFLLRILLKKIDLISIETKETYNEILRNGFCNKNLSNKIVYIPNGFDEEYLIENKVKMKSFEEKENIMITVGRIGTEEKNNEMLLEALNNLDLKEWKIYIIGSYTEDFKEKYDEFIKNNQDKKETVTLTGSIENKNLLYSYYNRAKVFLLTSKWEGFAIVYPEALRFGNYIITTDVGGARDITNNGKIGVVTEIENTIQFKNKILKVINNEINLEEKFNQSLELSKKQFLWNEIVKNKQFKKFFNEE
ncbi:glycosyltransferase [uncultured Fusobacterium sp.]|uniref:glycosyltransferase n=1 Tax=uncultured Fusobacterium sp. TaxID=159267 RepID=UPI0025E241EF|nr:glycosyltransferase [uncultured Fusobacterium sp.]